MKLRGITSEGLRTRLLFFCPGCKRAHPYRIARDPAEPETVPVWQWNGDMERPTFSPSLLIFPTPPNPDGTVYHQVRCHLFLTEGRIHFCSDCDHALAGQVVDCPEWGEGMW